MIGNRTSKSVCILYHESMPAKSRNPKKREPSNNASEDENEESNEPDYDEDKDQLEEQEDVKVNHCCYYRYYISYRYCLLNAS